MEKTVLLNNAAHYIAKETAPTALRPASQRIDLASFGQHLSRGAA